MMDDERGVMNGESSGTKLKVYSSVLPSQLMINWACHAQQYMLGFKDGRLRLGRAAVSVRVLKLYLRLSLTKERWLDLKVDYHSWIPNHRHDMLKEAKSFNALSLFSNSLEPSPEEADVPARHFSIISLFIFRSLQSSADRRFSSSARGNDWSPERIHLCVKLKTSDRQSYRWSNSFKEIMWPGSGWQPPF